MMKLRLAFPSVLVDISPLGYRGVDERASDLRLGALTTYDELLRSVPVPGLSALYECAARVGDLQVRNAGTIGGGLAHADPAADLAAGVLALGARLVLEAPDGTREVPAEAFFIGPFETELRHGELIVEILVPMPAEHEGSAYVSVENPASGYPLAGAAVRCRLEDRRIAACSIGITGATTRPFRATGLEELLVGRGEVPSIAEVVVALGEVETMGDVVADAEYRRQLAAVVVCRSAELALRRATNGVTP
jgi:CO/xanthine dehydrogenase FAD-binding subunit